MNRAKIILLGLIPSFLLAYGIWVGFRWTVMRVYVPPGKALVVINKFGKTLPPDRLTVPAEDNVYKGIQEEVRGPGRYFLNPVEYDYEFVDLVEVPAGEPQRFDWDENGKLKNPATAPMVGLVSLKEGKIAPPGREVVDPGYKGIQREVLTPGTYKINKHRYDVTLVPAAVVPPGSVGVVTRLIEGQTSEVLSTPLPAPTTTPMEASRIVTGPNERGILKDVIQPGIYYLNPRAVKVTIVPVGYDAISLENPHSPGGKVPNTAVSFYTSDGYQVEADFTVVWGRLPSDAPNIVANIGTVDLVRTNVIEPAMKAACQNEGANYSAMQLIQGQTREAFQAALSASLEKQVAARHIHVLLALVRSISIKDVTGKDATEGLLATIQRANIEKERQETNRQKTETAKVKASLEQALKLIDVARETVAAETNLKVANIMADSAKKAAEIDATREVEVADIALRMAQLEAQRTQILGKAAADVARLKNDAEAKGAKMMVDALGSPEAYNRYIFARNFEPHELRLFFAGPGTFWTDLKSMQDIGASKMIQQTEDQKR